MTMLTYEQLPCGVVMLNHEGVITYANTFMSTLLQRQQESLIGQHIEAFLSRANKFVFHSYFYPQLHTEGSVQEFMLHMERADGVQMPVMINAQRTLENDDEERIECILLPMTKRIEYEQELRQMTKKLERVNEQQKDALAQLTKLNEEIERKQQELITLTNTDLLTNIFNRRYMEERLAEHIVKARTMKHAFSVCILDIDYFKKVNDTYGHQIGDYVLIEVAQLLKTSVGEEGIVARFGGEEFVALLPNTTEEQSTQMAMRMNEAIRNCSFEYVQRVTISIGVSTYKDGDCETNLLNRADRALYYSKEHGRDRTTHFRDIEHVLHP